MNPHFRLTKKLYLSCAVLAVPAALFGQATFPGFTPGNLVVSRTVYTGDATTVVVGQKLPPNCPATAACPATAIATDNGAFPAIGSTNNVWNNAKADGSFGITSPIFLDQLTPAGSLVNTLPVPSGMVNTSFPSKSELGVNLSADGAALTFMAYGAPANTLDVSNSNTPGVVDPTNPVGASYSRSVVQVSAGGAFQITPTNAYSGNNGRAAFLANGLYYMVGNDNNGTGTADNLIFSTGAEIATPGQPATTVPTMIGNFSITQVNDPVTGKPYAADKLGKDNNFRGLTIYNNTMYVTKGSGGNGINTLYQVGTAGTLPTLANAATTKLTVVPGFPTTLAKNADAQFPFGIWFANPNTVYISDEGDGTMANLASSTTSGLQKWVQTNGVWQRVYVMQSGLGLGQQYGVTGYPAALNPATDGLRNITGRVNANGTVTVWAITSTVSANGDQGADPNRLVAITDILSNTSPAVAGGEQFTVVKSAGYAELLRGVAFTPGTTPVAPATSTAYVVSAANAGGAIAPGSLASAWGSSLATGPQVIGLPLPTSAGGTSVTIVDAAGKVTAANLVYVSPTQVNFLVPATVAPGAAQVSVTSGSGSASVATVQIAAVAPGLFTFNGGGLAAADIYRSAGGLQTLEQSYGIATDGTVVPNPIKGLKTDAIYVVLYGTGLQSAGTSGVQVTVGGVNVPVIYAGKQGSYAGLDQVNFQLPASLAGKGVVTIQLTAGGVAANPVTIAIQ